MRKALKSKDGLDVVRELLEESVALDLRKTQSATGLFVLNAAVCAGNPK